MRDESIETELTKEEKQLLLRSCTNKGFSKKEAREHIRNLNKEIKNNHICREEN